MGSDVERIETDANFWRCGIEAWIKSLDRGRLGPLGCTIAHMEDLAMGHSVM